MRGELIMRQPQKGFAAGILVILYVLFGISNGTFAKEAGAMQHSKAPAMPIHHLHITLLNHGLGMAVSGSSMIMLAELSKTKEVDSVINKHGQSMFDNGKDLIQRAMSGSEMQTLHEGEKGKQFEKVMTYTHTLGQAMLDLVNLLENMRTAKPTNPEDVLALHHMHMALNHALDMAEKGSNLIMVGQIHMASTIDPVSIKHGHAMIEGAKNLWGTLTTGEPMKQLMPAQKEPEAQVMARTHKIAEAGKKVLNLMAEMPDIQK